MSGPDPGEPETPELTALDDHRLAASLAAEAGRRLRAMRDGARSEFWSPWELGDEGDMDAHHYLLDRLAEARPGDAVLSEEGRDDRRRLEADRTWIVDPLDGSHDFSSGNADYAVHVGLVVEGRPVAGAVSLPDLDAVHATDDFDGPGDISIHDPHDAGRTEPVVIASRMQARWGIAVAEVLGGEALIAGSAGVKAMAVVRGDADVYLHPSGLYEWDACAPAAVAEAAGLVVCDIDGEPIEYNKDYPVVRGFIVARPRFVQPVLDALH